MKTISIMSRHIISSAFPAMTAGIIQDSLFRSDRDSIPVNISEQDGQLEIELSIPGYKKENLDLNLDDNNLLKIEGKIPEGQQATASIRKRRDFSIRPFSKSFRLGKDLDRQGIQATYQDGILRIFIPKSKREKSENSLSIPLQ